MEHKTLEAKATTTELGEFTAIAAAYSVDRGNERIVPGAFKATVERWQASGKMIPLHWDHEGSPESIVGVVDPATVKETDAGLMVSGKLDLENSDKAKEAWRAMKSNALGLSFGYMVRDGAKAKDGVYELKEIDLFEISITPSPMNADTRFLDLKSVRESLGLGPSIDEHVERLRKQTERDEVWQTDLVAVHGAIKKRRERLDEMEQMLIALQKKASEDVPAEGEDAKPDEAAPEPEAATDQAVEDAKDEEPGRAKSQAQDPLKQASRDAMLDVLSGGASSQKYVEPEKPVPVEPPDGADQYRRFVELHMS